MTDRYGQFCPVAKASEIMGTRWTPLILRELMLGSRTFGDIARGVPLMSRGLLSRRLRELEHDGVIAIVTKNKGRGHTYELTRAGEGLRPIIEAMGVWAQHWGTGQVETNDLDDALLMWSLHRAVRREQLPDRRVVIRFDLHGIRRSKVARRSWWLVVEADGVDVCRKDPGHEVDVVVGADLRALTQLFLGYVDLASQEKAGKIAFEGEPKLARQVPRWFGLTGKLMLKMGIDPPGPDARANSPGNASAS